MEGCTSIDFVVIRVTLYLQKAWKSCSTHGCKISKITCPKWERKSHLSCSHENQEEERKTDGLEIFQLQAFLATYNWRNSKHLSL